MIGRSSVIATNRWVVPEPARVRSIFAVADPKGALGEWTRTNNVQNLKIGQSDLTVDLVRQKAGSDSSLRVVVQVANSGAPGTPATKVQVARKATPTKVIGQSDVPPLEPGRTAQIVISLPEGTQPEGESSYIVTVDPDGTVMDFDLANNQFTFSSQLWLDSDKDGIPDKWELANHLGVNDPTDAARDDDQDGLTNLEEYRAGTDPADANSYLHVQLGPIELAESGRFRVTWGSVSGRLYTLERSANIEDGFEIIARHLQATSPQNTFEDQVPVGSEHYFYRIRVE